MKRLFAIVALLPLMTLAQEKDSIMIKKFSDEILRNGTAYDLL
jgi:hypothetical protein